MSQYLLDPYKPFPGFATLDNRRNKGQNCFFTGYVAFFSKILCFQQPCVLQKWRFNLHKKCQITLLFLGSVCFTGCYCGVENFVSLQFFVSNTQTVFPSKSMFSKGPSHFVLPLKSWVFEFSPERGSPTSVIDHVLTSQDYKKNWTCQDLTYDF